MSFRLVADIIDRAPYKDGTLLVLIALANWANDDGTKIFPYIDSLAEKARIGIRATQYALRKLESDGIVTLVKEGKGRQQSEYRIEVDTVRSWAEIGGQNSQKTAPQMKGVQSTAPQRCNPLHHRGATHCTSEVQLATAHIDNLSSKPISKPITQGAREDGTEGEQEDNPFAAIWKAFAAVPGFGPQMSEAKARRAWADVAADGISTDEMISAIGLWRERIADVNARRAKLRPPPGPVIIPHPHTWLAGGDWRQYLAATTPEATPPLPSEIPGWAIERLRAARLTDAEIRVWFAGATIESGPPATVHLASAFKARMVGEKFGAALRQTFGPDFQIEERKSINAEI
jgi:hypothetical protein